MVIIQMVKFYLVGAALLVSEPLTVEGAAIMYLQVKRLRPYPPQELQ